MINSFLQFSMCVAVVFSGSPEAGTRSSHGSDQALPGVLGDEIQRTSEVPGQLSLMGRHSSRENEVWIRDFFLQEVFQPEPMAFFTPNGDGFNDFWNIRGIEGLPEYRILIFDRYGKLLKQLKKGSLGWDGTFRGYALPSTDYWFLLEYTDDKGGQQQFKGHFSLKR